MSLEVIYFVCPYPDENLDSLFTTTTDFVGLTLVNVRLCLSRGVPS